MSRWYVSAAFFSQEDWNYFLKVITKFVLSKKIKFYVFEYMFLIRIFLITLAPILLGCRDSKKGSIQESKHPSTWMYLNIRANGKVFSVAENEDSLRIHFLTNREDSILSFKIESAEKDSLLTWAESLLNKKESPTNFCSDYFGKLDIKIIYSEQVTKKAEYTSICEWQNLDRAALKIHQLVGAKLNKN